MCAFLIKSALLNDCLEKSSQVSNKPKKYSPRSEASCQLFHTQVYCTPSFRDVSSLRVRVRLFCACAGSMSNAHACQKQRHDAMYTLVVEHREIRFFFSSLSELHCHGAPWVRMGSHEFPMGCPGFPWGLIGNERQRPTGEAQN